MQGSTRAVEISVLSELFAFWCIALTPRDTGCIDCWEAHGKPRSKHKESTNISKASSLKYATHDIIDITVTQADIDNNVPYMVPY